MLTLRDFLENINFYEHYRIYHPNRDCLVFESYFKVHSPYYLDKEHKLIFNPNYYNNNFYCNDVRERKEFDEETKLFLNIFGDYEIFSIECGDFIPYNIKKGEDGNLIFEETKDETQPNRDCLPCFNIFIR